jgi:peptidoglycan/LPS O-acetylase OafA/YrhL
MPVTETREFFALTVRRPNGQPRLWQPIFTVAPFGTGAGIAVVWSEGRPGWRGRTCVAIIVGATVAHAAWLVPGSGTDAPGWLAPALIVVGMGAVAAAFGSIARRSDIVFVGALGCGAVRELPGAGRCLD